MIILIGSEKGGVGKSTLATNLSAFFAIQGKDVILVDADRQSTSANWVQDRLESKKAKIDCVRQYDNIKSTLQSLNNRYDIVIVDCQGRDSKELRTGLLAADLVIAPFRPSQWDLDTLPTMVELIDNAMDLNPNLKACAILTMSPTNHNINELELARSVFKFDNLVLLKSATCDRKVYRDAASIGLSVLEMDNEKASLEISEIATELLTILTN
jgi:chromosome partitioning protein